MEIMGIEFNLVYIILFVVFMLALCGHAWSQGKAEAEDMMEKK